MVDKSNALFIQCLEKISMLECPRARLQKLRLYDAAIAAKLYGVPVHLADVAGGDVKKLDRAIRVFWDSWGRYLDNVAKGKRNQLNQTTNVQLTSNDSATNVQLTCNDSATMNNDNTQIINKNLVFTPHPHNTQYTKQEEYIKENDLILCIEYWNEYADKFTNIRHTKATEKAIQATVAAFDKGLTADEIKSLIRERFKKMQDGFIYNYAQVVGEFAKPKPRVMQQYEISQQEIDSKPPGSLMSGKESLNMYLNELQLAMNGDGQMREKYPNWKELCAQRGIKRTVQ